MNEMELLGRLRDEVPGEVLPVAAESALFTAIGEERSGAVPRSRRPRQRGPRLAGYGRPGRRWPGWVAPLAAAVAVTVVIVGTPAILSAIHAPTARPRAAGAAAPAIAWVAVQHPPTDEVVPIRIATRTVLPPVKTGHGLVAFAITPDGKTIYAASKLASSVTPIRTATRTVLSPIRTCCYPAAIAITPDGKTVYTAEQSTRGKAGHTVIPIRTADNTALPPIQVGRVPAAIAITPNGATAYVASAVLLAVRIGLTQPEWGPERVVT